MRLEDEIKQKRFKSPYHKLLVNILFTGSWLNAQDVRRLKPFGLSPQQYNILRILRGQYPQPARLHTITERMLDRMSNTSRLVEKLRRKGLVERQTCEYDRRAIEIRITEKGLALLEKVEKEEEKWIQQFKKLSEEEVNMLNELLDKLRS